MKKIYIDGGIRKKIFFLVFSFSLFVLPSFVHAAGLIKPPNNLGLVGYWSMNEGTSTVAHDFSGFKNDATSTSGTAPLWIDGKLGKALDFNGTSQFLGISKRDQLGALSGAVTICTWLYLRSYPGSESVIIAASEGLPNFFSQYSLEIESDGSLGLFWNADGSFPNINASTTIFPLNRWGHICGVRSSNSAGQFYFNGAPVGTNVAAGTIPTSVNQPANIGASRGGINQFINGKIDELRVYNRALSAAEVSTIYKTKLTQKDQTPFDHTLGLVGYWSMNEGTSSIAHDFSTFTNDATSTSGTAPLWTDGKLGKALDFNGSSQYLSVSKRDQLGALSGAMTACAWVYLRSYPGSEAVIIAASEGLPNFFSQYAFEIESDHSFSIQWNADGSFPIIVSSGATVPLNRWTHICIVRNSGSAGQAYLSGAPVGTNVAPGTIPASITQPANIGASRGGINQFFDGKIDELRVYNRALSASEINKLYTYGGTSFKIGASQTNRISNGLIGYWSFNGPDVNATNLLDRSGNGNDLNLLRLGIGKLGQAVITNGVDEFATGGDINAMDGLTRLTVSLWEKSNGISDERHIVGKSACNGGTNGGVFEVMISNGTHSPSFTIFKNGGSPNFFSAGGSAVVDDGKWHHIVARYDGVNAQTWVDGVLDGTTAVGAITLSSTADSFEIGGQCNGTPGLFFPGSIDEVRVYNRALSDAEIKQLYLMVK